MAVTLGNVLLLSGSILAAACALFWPQIEQAYLVHQSSLGGRIVHNTTAAAGVKGKCPLVSFVPPGPFLPPSLLPGKAACITLHSKPVKR